MSPCRADYLISQFAAAVAHFGALAPTPFRDSRYTFPVMGLGTVLSQREFHRFHAIHFQALSRGLEGTIVCSDEAARGDVPAVRRDRQARCRVDVGDQRTGGLGARVDVNHDCLDRRAGNAGERHIGAIRRAAGRGLARQRDRAGDARGQRNVGEVLMDGRLRRVRAGIDQDHLDGVGQPVELAFEKSLTRGVEQGV